ncbi:MAG: hypothetical protein LBF41_09650, partial [Deltaproteobacteria bacterium]|nr:hypothetical protein [Deltaproteobacteria bacterium]
MKPFASRRDFHYNGGARVRNSIKRDPNSMNEVIFSRGLASPSSNDVHTANDAEARFYRPSKAVAIVMPVSVPLNESRGKATKIPRLRSGA